MLETAAVVPERVRAGFHGGFLVITAYADRAWSKLVALYKATL